MSEQKLRHVSYSDVDITGGFWKKRQDLSRKSTVKAVYDRFTETGRFAALNCDWVEGKPFQPHVYWDSDVAKWLEGALYTLQKHPNAALERKINKIIDTFLKNQTPEGYFNSHFQTQEQEMRFQKMNDHELYCAGHWMEAAVAHFRVTGDRRFIDALGRYADYIIERFLEKKDTGFEVPGHEEIELALLKMYDATGDKKYLDLALHFINLRGVHPRSLVDKLPGNAQYAQNHAPVREQAEAVGHAVRAVYLYTAMADAAEKTGDAELKSACETLWRDITEKKMFITGSIGSSANGEAFTVPYDLFNLVAYSETCASIGLIYFAQRMLKMDLDSRYADVIERALYNCFLASTSLDGKAFYYENPQEIVPYLHTRDYGTSSIRWPKMQRSEIFRCSCCPPNIVRLIPSLGDYICSEMGDTVCVHQYAQCEINLSNGAKLKMETKYPQNGKVTFTLTGKDGKIAFRVPDWCKGHGYETVKGYATVEAKDGVPVTVDLPMKVQFIESRPEAVFNCGRYAVQRGPILYCAEEQDNGKNLRDLCIVGRQRWKMGVHPELGVPTLEGKATRRVFEDATVLYREKEDTRKTVDLTLIPYYAMANRGEAEMLLWFQVK